MNLVYCNNDASSRDVLLLAEGKIDVLRVGIGQNLDVLWVPVHRFDIMCVGRGPNRRSKRSPFCRRVPKKFKKEFCEKGPPPPHSLPSLSLSLSSKGIRLNAAAAAFTHCPSCGGAINYCTVCIYVRQWLQ